MARITQGRGDVVLQRQETRKNGWTKQHRIDFLTALAETSNVRMSARRVGRHLSGAYALRARDPVFAALWQAALEDGYRLLEGELLAAARGHQADDENPTSDELAAAERPAPAIDTALALKTLQLRQARERHGMAPHARFVRMTQEQVDEKLSQVLDRIAAAVRRKQLS